MPMRDYYLTLSGLTAAGAVPGAQPILSTASLWANAPFDLGLQVTSEYGQSPYQSANLVTIKPTIGQAPKKFFFLVTATTAFAAASVGVGMSIQLTTCATAAGTKLTNLVVLQSQLFIASKLSAGAISAGGVTTPVLIKVPIPESQMNRYLNGRFKMSTAASLGVFTAGKVIAELTTY